MFKDRKSESTIVSEKVHPLIELLQQDQRYHIEAYQFVRDALSYSQEILQMKSASEMAEEGENHITGQQLCEGIRQYSLQQYGYMAKVVLNTWGIFSTGDFGEIVYNLIRIKQMKKSDTDRREDFDGVFDFENGFDPQFELSGNDE